MTVLFCLASVLILLFIVFLIFPYSCFRCLVRFLRVTCYHVKLMGRENIPEKGPALLAANHISLFDALILIGLTRRPIYFMMHEKFYEIPLFHFIFRRCGVIKVPSAGKNK